MLRRSFIVALGLSALGVAPCRGQDIWPEQPDRLATLLYWHSGTLVAEIGASNGKLTVAAAQRVGPSGRVYSTEIDAKALALLEELAAKEGNIVPIKAAEADTNLPPHPVTRYLCGSCIITSRDRLKSTQAFAGR